MARTMAEIISSIEDKQARAAELHQKLQGSLTLADLWPEVFEKGSASVGGRATIHEPQHGKIIITRGDGSKREFPALEVPFRLWPVGMQENYKKLPAHVKKFFDKKLIK